MNTKKKDNIIVSIFITILLFSAILSLIWLCSPDAFKHVKEMRFNDWGDFLGGTFGTVALFWLILGYILQKQELQQNTKALKLQAEELKNTVEEYRHMVEVNKQQFLLYKKELDILNSPNLIIDLTYSYRYDREHMLSLVELYINIKNVGGEAQNIKIKIENVDGECEIGNLKRGENILRSTYIEFEKLHFSNELFISRALIKYSYLMDNRIENIKIMEDIKLDNSVLEHIEIVNSIV